jgi:hypothetical protein
MPPNLRYLLLAFGDDEARVLERRLRDAPYGAQVRIYHAHPRTNAWKNSYEKIVDMAESELQMGDNGLKTHDKCRGIERSERMIYSEQRDLNVKVNGDIKAQIQYALRVAFQACEDGDVRPVEHRTCTYYPVDKKIVRKVSISGEKGSVQLPELSVEVPLMPPVYYSGNCNEALDTHFAGAFVGAHEDVGIAIDQWMKIFHEDRPLVDKALMMGKDRLAGMENP